MLLRLSSFTEILLIEILEAGITELERHQYGENFLTDHLVERAVTPECPLNIKVHHYRELNLCVMSLCKGYE